MSRRSSPSRSISAEDVPIPQLQRSVARERSPSRTPQRTPRTPRIHEEHASRFATPLAGRNSRTRGSPIRAAQIHYSALNRQYHMLRNMSREQQVALIEEAIGRPLTEMEHEWVRLANELNEVRQIQHVINGRRFNRFFMDELDEFVEMENRQIQGSAYRSPVRPSSRLRSPVRNRFASPNLVRPRLPGDIPIRSVSPSSRSRSSSRAYSVTLSSPERITQRARLLDLPYEELVALVERALGREVDDLEREFVRLCSATDNMHLVQYAINNGRWARPSDMGDDVDDMREEETRLQQRSGSRSTSRARSVILASPDRRRQRDLIYESSEEERVAMVAQAIGRPLSDFETEFIRLAGATHNYFLIEYVINNARWPADMEDTADDMRQDEAILIRRANQGRSSLSSSRASSRSSSGSRRSRSASRSRSGTYSNIFSRGASDSRPSIRNMSHNQIIETVSRAIGRRLTSPELRFLEREASRDEIEYLIQEGNIEQLMEGHAMAEEINAEEEQERTPTRSSSRSSSRVSSREQRLREDSENARRARRAPSDEQEENSRQYSANIRRNIQGRRAWRESQYTPNLMRPNIPGEDVGRRPPPLVFTQDDEEEE